MRLMTSAILSKGRKAVLPAEILCKSTRASANAAGPAGCSTASRFADHSPVLQIIQLCWKICSSSEHAAMCNISNTSILSGTGRTSDIPHSAVVLLAFPLRRLRIILPSFPTPPEEWAQCNLCRSYQSPRACSEHAHCQLSLPVSWPGGKPMQLHPCQHS